MIEPPQVTESAEQQAAVIHLTIPRAEIRNAMGPGFSELMAAVTEQGITPTGPWFAHHHRMAPDTFDFDIGVPISGDFKASGRVQPGQLPAATVARTVYHGGYEGLGDGWGEFQRWIESEGHEAAPDLWEVYAIGPESSPDPADWRTELNRPLIGR